MELCNVCERNWEKSELKENYRGMLECPECGTELTKNKGYGKKVKRDRFSNKTR